MRYGIEALREICRLARECPRDDRTICKIEALAREALAPHELAIERAKAAGGYKGRPVTIDAAEVRRLTQTMSPTAVAEKMGIARSSVYRLAAEGERNSDGV